VSPTSHYDTPQDASLQIKQLLKENANLKLKARHRWACALRRSSRLGAPV